MQIYFSENECVFFISEEGTIDKETQRLASCKPVDKFYEKFVLSKKAEWKRGGFLGMLYPKIIWFDPDYIPRNPADKPKLKRKEKKIKPLTYPLMDIVQKAIDNSI